MTSAVMSSQSADEESSAGALSVDDISSDVSNQQQVATVHQQMILGDSDSKTVSSRPSTKTLNSVYVVSHTVAADVHLWSLGVLAAAGCGIGSLPKWVRDERAFQEESNATLNVKNGGRSRRESTGEAHVDSFSSTNKPAAASSNDNKGPLIQIKTASQRLTQTTSHSARQHIFHQLVIQSQDITRDASSCWYRSQNQNSAFQLNETASHRIRHPIFQQLGATTKTNQRLGPQNDVASTNPNDDVLYPLQELSVDIYKSAVASQNVTVSKSYSALLLKST
ncbi:Thymidylate kinase-like protein [Dorcoceras hygrometricum]|uniref:Thymidylate kinase-like protein n=1 Tax=Dorcoceras hygrometricum TaxID=472368 RepID=A0A2Z7AL29_9LAMI|nr:Thymidylate kinase-like protein [Dorcoceras hygrometricum]